MLAPAALFILPANTNLYADENDLDTTSLITSFGLDTTHGRGSSTYICDITIPSAGTFFFRPIYFPRLFLYPDYIGESSPLPATSPPQGRGRNTRTVKGRPQVAGPLGSMDPWNQLVRATLTLTLVHNCFDGVSYLARYAAPSYVPRTQNGHSRRASHF